MESEFMRGVFATLLIEVCIVFLIGIGYKIGKGD